MRYNKVLFVKRAEGSLGRWVIVFLFKGSNSAVPNCNLRERGMEFAKGELR